MKTPTMPKVPAGLGRLDPEFTADQIERVNLETSNHDDVEARIAAAAMTDSEALALATRWGDRQRPYPLAECVSLDDDEQARLYLWVNNASTSDIFDVLGVELTSGECGALARLAEEWAA